MPSPEPGPSEPRPGSLRARPALTVGAGGVALILAAYTFGAVPLFVPGVGFLLVALAGPGWVLTCGRAARVRRRLSAQRVVEDEPFEAVIEVRRGPLGLPGAAIQDPVARGAGSIAVGDAVSLIAGQSHVELRVVARIRRRGRHAFAPPTLQLSDSLGLVRLTRLGDGEPDEVLVLPRVEPVRWAGREQRRSVTGQALRSTLEPIGAGEVDGLRDYMPGSPASRIHWLTLARHQFPPTLLERRLVSAPQTRALIVLDPRLATDPEAEARLDAAVRAAASLALSLARAGGCSLLLPGERQPVVLGADLARWPAVHTRLALVQGERDPRHAPALRDAAARGPLVYVAAQLDPPAAVPGTGPRATGDVIVVLPLSAPDRPDQPAALAVSGCAGYLIRRGRRTASRPTAREAIAP
jgi:uncharacterized protein (DUF58 family)